jgi:hypothetical protein
LKAANTVLALAVLALLVLAAWQAMRVSALTAGLAQAERALDGSVARLASDRLTSLRREELVGAIEWLDEFYRSADGLQRPNGLWRPEANQPDAEAIGVWILDVYLQARMTGAADAEARQVVMDQITGTDEWRRKHAP